MKFTNIGDSEELKFVVKDNFEMKNNRPKFNKEYTDPVNAKAFAAELIKHTYQNGWSLPEMPS